MTDTMIALYCPKCGERVAETPANLNTDQPFTCHKCGSVSTWGELKTESGTKLTDHVANMARDALKGKASSRTASSANIRAACPASNMQNDFDSALIERLGWLIMRWSYLEHLIAELFCWLSETHPVPMTVVTANVSASTLMDWCRALLDIRDDDAALREEIRALFFDINEVRPERNALVHGIWALAPEPHAARVQTVRLERTPVVQEELVTAADLDSLILETCELATKLRALLLRVGVNV